MNANPNTDHSIPMPGDAVREWIDDARYLAYPDRAPESDEAVKQAVRLIRHLASYLRRSAREDVDTAFLSIDSESTFEVAWQLPDICWELVWLCQLLGRRYREFAHDEAIRLRGNLGDGLHPEVSRVEATGIATSVAETYAITAGHLEAVYTALSAIRSSTGRISMEVVAEEGQR